MKTTSLFVLAIGLFTTFGFQVNPDNNALTKEAIGKTIKAPKPTDTRPYHETFSDMLSGLPHRSERIDPGPPKYWFHTKIHTFGNTGLFGALHAAVAPIATKLIDLLAYDGYPIREEISRELRRLVGKSNARVLDLCCGVGISTRALQEAFEDAELVVGVDTSPEMIEMAKMLSSKNFFTNVTTFFSNCLEGGSRTIKKGIERFPSYRLGNAERTGLASGSFDLVTVMYGFHEIPFRGRYCILREVRRVLADGATLAIVDISPDYIPKASMLAGEPYVLEYKRNIEKQLGSVRGFANVQMKTLIPGHVSMWLLTRKRRSPVLLATLE